MGKQLQDNNPQITNLNDPNRPQKLSEMLSDIYDNEWLEAFTGLQSQDENLDEQSAVDILFNLLKVPLTHKGWDKMKLILSGHQYLFYPVLCFIVFISAQNTCWR